METQLAANQEAKTMILVETNVLPCPCCGCVELLDVGVMSAMSYGVKCRSCGLAMEKGIPSRYPSGCNTVDDVRCWTTNKAIAAWNKRV
jgi:hypothetical protein